MRVRIGDERKSFHPAALSLAILLVCAAILVGIYGRRLDERPSGNLVPLGEVLDALRQMQVAMQLDAIHRSPDAAGPTSSDIAELVRSTTGGSWRPPDLAPSGFVPVIGGPIDLPGCAGGGGLLYEREGEQADRFLLLFFTPDHGRFVTFDTYGRAESLMSSQTFAEVDDETDPASAATLAYSNGEMLVIYRAASAEVLEQLRNTLGAP